MTNDFVYTEEMYKEDKKISNFVFKNRLFLPEDIKAQYKDDLIQDSLIALYNARQNFEKSKGVKYISYAVKISLRKMLLYLKREDHKGKIFNKISLSEPITEDLTLEEMLGEYDIYNGLEQEQIRQLKEVIKSVITAPKHYTFTYDKRKIKNRKTKLTKSQIISLEYYIDGISRQELQNKYNVSRQCIEQHIHKYSTKIKQELLKNNLLN